MSENTVLDQPCKQYDASGRLEGDVTDLKGCRAAVGAGLAEVNGRLDGVEVRLDRIERRLLRVDAG